MEELLIRIGGLFALAFLLFFFSTILNGILLLINVIDYVNRLEKLKYLEFNSFLEVEKIMTKELEIYYKNLKYSFFSAFISLSVVFIFQYFNIF